MTSEAYSIRIVGDDSSALAQLRRQWNDPSGEHDGDAAFEATFANWWATEKHTRRAYVAFSGDDEPVGMANGKVFSRMPSPGLPTRQWMYGANVFVTPPHRRRGVARALMDALIDDARSSGMVRIVLAPSPMSLPFYASLGFRVADDLMRLDFPAAP